MEGGYAQLTETYLVRHVGLLGIDMAKFGTLSVKLQTRKTTNTNTLYTKTETCVILSR
jgi:hypothetical protein